MERTSNIPKNSSEASNVGKVRQEILKIANEEGSKLFSARGISWIRLGLVNYIKSWRSEDYAKMVREEFKLALPQRIESRAAKIRNITDEAKRLQKWKKLAKDITAIPESDMLKLAGGPSNREKIDLMIKVTEFGEIYKDNILISVQNSIIGTEEIVDEGFNEALNKVRNEMLEISVESSEDGDQLRMKFAKKLIDVAMQCKLDEGSTILRRIDSSSSFSSEQKSELGLYLWEEYKVGESIETLEGQFKQIEKGNGDYSWKLLSQGEAKEQLRYSAAASASYGRLKVIGERYGMSGSIRLEKPNIGDVSERDAIHFAHFKNPGEFNYVHQRGALEENGSLFGINDRLDDGITSNIQESEDTDFPGYFDLETGMKFVILEDINAPNNIIISFAPALAKIGKDEDLNGKFEDRQLKIATMQLLGAETPMAYKQAAKIVEKLKADNPGKKIILSGYCFGGSLAQYAGLMNEVETHCFNGLPLGIGLQKDIPAEKLANADQLVTQISVRNEWVSNMQGIGYIDRGLSYLGIPTPANFGKRYVVNPLKEDHSAHKRHMSIDKAMMAHAGYVSPENN